MERFFPSKFTQISTKCFLIFSFIRDKFILSPQKRLPSLESLSVSTLIDLTTFAKQEMQSGGSN